MLVSASRSDCPRPVLTCSYVLWYQFRPGGARHKPCLAIPWATALVAHAGRVPPWAWSVDSTGEELAPGETDGVALLALRDRLVRFAWQD